MISALAWVPKGASKRMPEKQQLSKEEIAMMHNLAQEEAEEEAEMEAAVDADMPSDDELPESFKMDEYDEEDDDAAIQAYINQNDQDGGDGDEKEDEATDADGNVEMGDDDDDEDDELENDKEDLEIRPDDSVVLVATTEEEYSNLEVQIYDEEAGALYVHHEITLPAFPLSLAWMNTNPNGSLGDKGSYVAVGTFKPGIEIWDLNVLDVLEPSATLGGEDDPSLRDVAMPTSRGKKKKKNERTMRQGSHADAVMTLDWNRHHRQHLASGSADTTVKVWDITTQQCTTTLSHHKDKVQSVKWHPTEGSVLASAAFDRSLIVLDGRTPDAFSSFALTSDVESLCWAPHSLSTIVASTEDGMISAFDVRMNNSAPLYRFQAHAGAVSSIAFSNKVPGMMASAGVDKTVKVWDTSAASSSKAPTCITSKEMMVGELFTMEFAQSEPFLLGCGGDKGVLALWDVSENQGVERHFSSRVQEDGAVNSEGLDLSKSFQSADQIAEELAMEEETMEGADGKKSGKKKKPRSKKK